MLILTYAMNWSFSAFSWSAILACCLIQRSSSCWLSCSTFLYFSSRPVYVSCKAWCSSFNIYKQREKTISQSSWKKIIFSTKKKDKSTGENNSNKQRKKTTDSIQSTFVLRLLAELRVSKLRKAHPWFQSPTTKGTCRGKTESRSEAHLLSFMALQPVVMEGKQKPS